jgi:hypothetical protein
MERGAHCDSYARHFISIWPRGAASPWLWMQRDLIKCNVLQKGNPMYLVKTFSKSTCTLCNRERMEIVKLSQKIPELLINYCSKFTEHADTRHKPRFHRYHKQKPSADERNKREKVVPNAINPKRRRIISFDTASEAVIIQGAIL